MQLDLPFPEPTVLTFHLTSEQFAAIKQMLDTLETALVATLLISDSFADTIDDTLTSVHAAFPEDHPIFI
jgi:hypothetical protein